MNNKNELFNRIVGLLEPHMEPGSRDTLITLAFTGYKIYSQIDKSGAPHTFTTRLIQQLSEYSEIEPGLPALNHLLETVKKEVGPDNQRKITKILEELNQAEVTFPELLNTPTIDLEPKLMSLLEEVKRNWVSNDYKLTPYDSISSSVSQTDQILINLDREILFDIVGNQKATYSSTPNKSKLNSLENYPISYIFQEVAYQSLLILGEPGSGKTTMLLELVDGQIENVRQHKSRLIPVVFKLDSWTQGQSIFDWLVDEQSYRTGRKEIRINWLENDQLLLFFDGLDQVSPLERRLTCLQAINEFIHKYKPEGIVVTCRYNEYMELVGRDELLNLEVAIKLKPLNQKKIDDYLINLGPVFSALREEICNREDFQDLAQSPLMLYSMGFAFQDLDESEFKKLDSSSNEINEKEVFNFYIDRAFGGRRSSKGSYSREETTDMLVWLAQQMGSRESTFLIEQLQPDWLPSLLWKICYLFATRISNGLLVGLALALLMGSVLDGVVFGITGGLTVAVIDSLRFNLPKGLLPWANKRAADSEHLKPSIKVSIWKQIFSGLFVWLFVAIPHAIVAEWLTDTRVLNLFLAWSIVFGFIFGSRSSLRETKTDVKCIRDLKWSFQGAMFGGVVGTILIFLITAPLTVLIYSYYSGEVIRQWILITSEWANFIPIDEWRVALGCGLLFGIVVGGPCGIVVGSGPLDRFIPQKDAYGDTSQPNYGIWLSAKSALYSGLVYGSISTMVFSLIFIFMAGNLQVVFKSMTNGLAVGLLAALWFGGLDVLNHGILRSFLYVRRYMPINYALFLKYGVDRVLLQKIGGGYEFKHELLRKHFADMDVMSNNLDKRRATMVFGIITILFTILILLSIDVSTLFNLSDELPAGVHNLSLSADSKIPLNATHIQVKAGDTIRIESRGQVKVGPFLGYISAEGTNFGLLGFPLGQGFNIVKEYPHGTIMCRVSGEGEWRRCAFADAVWKKIFSTSRSTQFKARTDGYLQFNINDNEKLNNSGEFYITVKIKS